MLQMKLLHDLITWHHIQTEKYINRQSLKNKHEYKAIE